MVQRVRARPAFPGGQRSSACVSMVRNGGLLIGAAAQRSLPERDTMIQIFFQKALRSGSKKEPGVLWECQEHGYDERRA